MKRKPNGLTITRAALLLALTVSQLEATHGFFMTGHGTKSIGMGGIAAAYAQDSLVAATNPAGMVRLGNRADIGLHILAPKRKYSYTGSDASVGCHEKVDQSECEITSDTSVFAMGHAGINYMFTKDDAFGVSFFQNGWMNTNYPENNVVFAGTGLVGDNVRKEKNCDPCGDPLGLNLMQWVIAPTYSHIFRSHESFDHTIGIAPLIGIQAFKTKGLHRLVMEEQTEFNTECPKPLCSVLPCHVTNRNHDMAGGIGVQAGWTGRMWDHYHFGFSYASKVFMSKLKAYRGFLADDGKFHMPAHLSAGFAVSHLVQGLIFGFDYQRIFYGDIKALGNPFERAGLKTGACEQRCFGEARGPGFGWKSTSVFKFGASFQVCESWIFRVGASHNRFPFKRKRNKNLPPEETDFACETTEADLNILMPATVENHVTLGFSHQSNGHEFDFAYVHGIGNKVTGPSALELGDITLEMRQHSVEFNYGYRW